VADTRDLWLFHDADDCREVKAILSFGYYAISPSTERVVYSPDGAEVRAYGGQGRFVWYTIPAYMDRWDGSMLTGLFSELEKAGKLSVV
jgi:hypothetical protein